jgi:hypothetical protein
VLQDFRTPVQMMIMSRMGLEDVQGQYITAHFSTYACSGFNKMFVAFEGSFVSIIKPRT